MLSCRCQWCFLSNKAVWEPQCIYKLGSAFPIQRKSHSCLQVIPILVLFLMLHFYYVVKGHALKGYSAKCLLLLTKNVLCLALWLFLRSEPKWIYENVTCSTLLYSFNEKFFPFYVRQCLSELISHYVKEKSTWLILKELFDT